MNVEERGRPNMHRTTTKTNGPWPTGLVAVDVAIVPTAAFSPSYPPSHNPW